MADWLDLPQVLLERIACLCIISDPRISPDFIRMMSVCKSWRSILKYEMPRELPWLMMLPNSSSNKEEEEEENPPLDGDARLFYSPSNQKIHTISLPEIRGKRCCGSSQNGWLMIVDGKMDIFLFHTWSRKKIDLPHLSAIKRRNHLSIFKHRNHEVPISSCDFHIHKAALSDDLKIVVIIYLYGFVCFWRMGDVAYTVITAGAGIREQMEDVIYHKGQFYALGDKGSVFLLHIEEGFRPSARAKKLTVYLVEHLVPNPRYKYLVPDILTDSLFVITRDIITRNFDFDPPSVTLRFDIFRVPLEKGSHGKRLKKLTTVESLGDRALFLGYNSSIIVRASQFSGCKGNHIYFAVADNRMEKYYLSGYGCPDSGVFSLEGATFEELVAERYHPSESMSLPLWIATPPYSSQIDSPPCSSQIDFGGFWRKETTPPYSSQIDFGGKKLRLEEPHDVST